MTDPLISLVICTRDRAEKLKQCLARLPTEEILELGAEIILVDNGSRDETPCVLREFAERQHFPLNLVEEKRPGLGNARNAGLACCRADTIAFTDDDCYLSPGYLSIAVKNFGRNIFQYCGGRILAHDPSDSLYGCSLQTRRQNIPPYSFVPAGLIQGANMIIRREVFKAIGEFDPNFGAGTRFRCEDIDLIGRASMAGFTGAYVPDLVVYHHHCREDGPDIERLVRANDHARGAYFAKFLINGHFAYLRGWISSAIEPTNTLRTAREISGALDYVRCVKVLRH